MTAKHKVPRGLGFRPIIITLNILFTPIYSYFPFKFNPGFPRGMKVHMRGVLS